jgi:hypothetical protein
MTAPSSNPLPDGATGEQIYRAACLTCHGEDGRGGAPELLGNVEPPDFSDCAFASAEPDPDWHAVVSEGGPVRGLGRHMPAFGDALTADQIALAIGHVRTFCRDPSWPRGDLNLPRAFFTEKAFPENEAVWTTGTNLRRIPGAPGARSIANEIVYERRLGSRNQIEVVVPIDANRGTGGDWTRGIGDAALAFKRVVYASMDTGGIGSAGLEVILPTGKETHGLGNGYAVFEPFAMWGQILPRNSFVQVHGGAELPTDTGRGTREYFLRTSVGTTFAQDRGWGRAWTPQVEVLIAHPEREQTEWDVVPQMQISLSKLQHVMVAVGVRIPINLRDRDGRQTQALVYLLWDWFDGGFFEFWK